MFWYFCAKDIGLSYRVCYTWLRDSEYIDYMHVLL